MGELFSTGGAAKELGVSMSQLRKLERLGVTAPAHRLAGSDRRVYDAQQMEALRRILASRRHPQMNQKIAR